MNKTDVAVVILNWNGKHFLEKFLHLIIDRSREHARVIVADNCSVDGSAEYIGKNFPDIEFLQFEDNLGYAGGYNRALKLIKAKYYVLLNSDIEVCNDWLMPVIELMENNNEISACQPKIMQYDQADMFEYAGAAGGFVDFLGYPFCRGRIFFTLEKDNAQYDKGFSEVFWASGACMFLRAEHFHEVGGFDENFFAHMEEIDLCWRLKRNGKNIVFCPESVVYHIGGGTLPKTNPRKTYLNFRNSLWVITKNLPAKKLYISLIIRLILDSIAIFKFLIDRNFKDSIAVLKAYISFFGKFRHMRKSYYSTDNHFVSHKYIRSIVYDYFVKNRKYFKELPEDKFT